MPIAAVLPANGPGGTVTTGSHTDRAIVVPVLRYLFPLEIHGLTFDQVDARTGDVDRLMFACWRQGDRPQHSDVNPAATRSVGGLDDTPTFFTTPHRNDTCAGHCLSVVGCMETFFADSFYAVGARRYAAAAATRPGRTFRRSYADSVFNIA
jgi:hypothetical protein